MEHDLSRSSELCAILSDKSGKLLKDLRERMRVQHCDEILEFIIAVEKSRKYSTAKRVKKVREIKEKFIFADINSPYLINISEETRKNILKHEESDEKIFDSAKNEMIYLIESDVLNRDHVSESSLSQWNSNLDEVSQLTTMDNRSMKRSTSRYDLSSIFEKAQQKLSLHKMRSSSSSSRSCKINSKCVSIALPNIFQHISYEIKDSNDSIESIISRLFNQYKIFSNNYEIYCNNNAIPKESKIRNYVGMHLNVEYRIIFFITLPSGKRLGLKVNAFRDFKTLIVPVLLRYGYRMKNYIFTINENTVPIDPGDIVTKLEGKEIKMKLKNQS